MTTMKIQRFSFGFCLSVFAFCVVYPTLPGCAAARRGAAVEPAPAVAEPTEPAVVAQAEEAGWDTFVATAYCSCTKCCGKNAQGITAAGFRLKPGSRVVAVDPSVIPLRSRIEIDGLGEFAALDTGSAIKGRRIDIWFESHRDAREFGRKAIRVRVGQRLPKGLIELVALPTASAAAGAANRPAGS